MKVKYENLQARLIYAPAGWFKCPDCSRITVNFAFICINCIMPVVTAISFICTCK